MAEVSHPSVIKPFKVPQNQLLGTIWSLLALAILCSAFRLLVRMRAFRTLLVDDYFVIAALVFAIANAIIWQIYSSKMYYVLAVSAGAETPQPDFANVAESYWKASVAVIILYYSALWAWLWWPVFLFTVSTYLTCIGDIQYGCLVNSLEWVETHCATEQAGHFLQVTLKLNCAWDVLTDFLIMLLPFHLLRGVQLNARRKLALTGIFSLVIITMIFSTIRTALVGSSHSSIPDSSWLYLWSAIEVSVAIMVTSGTCVRSLFSHEPPYPPPLPPIRQSNYTRPRNWFLDLLDTLASTDMLTQVSVEQVATLTSNNENTINPSIITYVNSGGLSAGQNHVGKGPSV